MIQETYTSAQTMRLTGITARRLQYWDETGFISPSVTAGKGKGNPRQFAYVDLLAIRAAVKLRRLEISLQTLRKVNERMRAYEGASFANAFLVGDMIADVVIQSGDELISLLHNPGQVQFAWVMSIGEIEREVQAAIAELRAA